MTEFTVLGRPQPAGSKRAIPFKRKDGNLGINVKDDAKRSRPWKDSVAAAAHECLDGAPPLEGALYLEVDFFFQRPAAHFGSGRNSQIVKPSAPRFPSVRPDVTKLLRAVEDALTGLAWRDDAQVVVQQARKKYGTPERAEVLILSVDELMRDGP